MLPLCRRHLMADRLIKQQQQFAEHHGASRICQHLPRTHISVGRARANQAQITSLTRHRLPIPAKAFLAPPGFAALRVHLPPTSFFLNAIAPVFVWPHSCELNVFCLDWCCREQTKLVVFPSWCYAILTQYSWLSNRGVGRCSVNTTRFRTLLV